MDELADVEAYPGETESTAHEAALWKRSQAPLADWAPGEVTEAYGR